MAVGITLLIVVLTVTYSNAYAKEMTVNIDAGKIDCFYNPAKKGEVIDIEYQVIDGAHGELDISFTLAQPDGKLVVSERKKSENVHRFEVQKDGDHRFCFDNTFSTFNAKTVFFELIVEKVGEYEDDSLDDVLEGLSLEQFYDMKVQDFTDYIVRIRALLTKARQIQDILRSNDARDRNIAEENFFKVNMWSFFQVCTMVGVSTFQVYALRSIFDSDSKLLKLWRKTGF